MKLYFKRFKNLQTFERAIKKDIHNLKDVIKIGDILFTQDSYDISGQSVTYGNKAKQKAVEVCNQDRYKSTHDTKVSEITFFERIGFPYVE